MKKSIAIALSLMTTIIACKKEVKPEDTVATAAPVQSVAPPVELPDASLPVLDSGVAPLTSLEAPKKAAPTKPKADPPECVQARVTCSNPNVGVNARAKKGCDDQKAACIKAGGKICADKSFDHAFSPTAPSAMSTSMSA